MENSEKPTTSRFLENIPSSKAPDELQANRNTLIPDDVGFYQPPAWEINVKMRAVQKTYFSPTTNEQPHQETLLRDIFLESSLPFDGDDVLTLIIIWGNEFKSVHLTKFSSTKWKAVENGNIHRDISSMMLIVRSKDQGDEAFIKLTAKEIYAMACVEEDIEAARVCPLPEDVISVSVVLNFTYQSSVQCIHPGDNDLSSRFNNKLGILYFHRFQRTGNFEDIDNAISIFQRTVDSTSSGHAYILSLLNNLGNSYTSRFNSTGNLEDIDHAIFNHQRAVNTSPSGHAELSTLFCNLGKSYSTRFTRTGNLEDIEHAIFHLQGGVKSTPSGHARLPDRLDSLGNSYKGRFERTGNLEDIDHAISHHQKGIKSTPLGHADLPIWFKNLGISYFRRFERTGNVEDIDHAIFHYQKAVDSNSSGHTDPPSLFICLANSYLLRFKRTGHVEGIDLAISNHQKAVDSNSSKHISLPTLFSGLANSYSHRFKCTGNLEDSDHAISILQKAVNSTPSGHADLPFLFSTFGCSYLVRFLRTGSLVDIDHAISFLQKAIDSNSPGDANLPGWLGHLGTSYERRFNSTGNLEDIDRAISILQKAVSSTRSGDADLPGRFNNLGNSYSGRWKRTGNLEDIDHAISHYQNAIDSTPSDHADRSSLFCNIGGSYTSRFERTGNLEDIEHAISILQRAVDSNSSSLADIQSLLTGLGNSYLSRFNSTGNLEDIDHAISHHQRAVNSSPSDHADLSILFCNLGGSYLSRFEHNHNLEDIEHAVFYHQKAVDSTPSDHAGFPARFNSLGSSHLHRFRRTGNLKDIDHAISHHQMAVSSSPSDHAQLPNWLKSLGNSYSCRFEHSGNLEDIDHAIFYHQRAVDSTPSGHARLPDWLGNLGTSYKLRFKRTGNLEDINHAVSHHQNAVDSTPSGRAYLPALFSSLGSSYKCRFERTHRPSDLQNSIASYRQAADANGAPSIRLQSAWEAGILSFLYSTQDDSDSHCLNDFALAISLLSEVAGLEQLIHRRHSNLHDHSMGFVAHSVAHALHCNKPDLALEWLEQGRCLVWNQVNQLRTPIENLQKNNPSLANRFINVTHALESYGTRSVVSNPSLHNPLAEEIRLQDDTRNHTICATEHRQLLKEIRSLPDFQDFLQPPKAADILSSLPFDGPVITFNLNETRCDALAVIIGMDEPLNIHLDNFSLAEAKKMQKMLQFDLLKRRETEDHQDRAARPLQPNLASMSLVLKELWCKVVEPILKALAYSPQLALNPSHRRRIWWCPTGPLAFLPLHAAGIYGSASRPGSCVSDFVVSSYTPTIRSLNDKSVASSTSSKYTSLVLISQPNTPGLPSIPATQAETHVVAALMRGTAIDTLLLEGSSATTERVKSELESRSWVHLACHGVQDVSQPLQSGLCLHDGRLELLEIMKQKMRNPELAFLSACQTGKGDLELSDEVVHLSAGMLAAGYRGVVGTMWSISDTHGPDFAKEFYEYLLKDGKGLDSSRAAYALDHATRKVRERLGESDISLMTWVPYVHFGY